MKLEKMDTKKNQCKQWWKIKNIVPQEKEKTGLGENICRNIYNKGLFSKTTKNS